MRIMTGLELIDAIQSLPEEQWGLPVLYGSVGFNISSIGKVTVEKDVEFNMQVEDAPDIGITVAKAIVIE